MSSRQFYQKRFHCQTFQSWINAKHFFSQYNFKHYPTTKLVSYYPVFVSRENIPQTMFERISRKKNNSKSYLHELYQRCPVRRYSSCLYVTTVTLPSKKMLKNSIESLRGHLGPDNASRMPMPIHYLKDDILPERIKRSAPENQDFLLKIFVKKCTSEKPKTSTTDRCVLSPELYGILSDQEALIDLATTEQLQKPWLVRPLESYDHHLAREVVHFAQIQTRFRGRQKQTSLPVLVQTEWVYCTCIRIKSKTHKQVYCKWSLLL